MTVTLPPELEAFVDQRIQSGQYASREDWIAQAFQSQQNYDEKLTWLKAAIAEGMASMNREKEFSMDELMEEIDRELAFEQSR
jgi:putative addiction module CopG family antidote